MRSTRQAKAHFVLFLALWLGLINFVSYQQIYQELCTPGLINFLDSSAIALPPVILALGSKQ